MRDQQKEWQKQYWANFGLRELLRFIFGFLIWLFIGVALAMIFNSAVIFYIFFIAIFALPFLTPWQPAYSLLRKILGNKSLPTQSMPRRQIKLSSQPRLWWSYLPGIWGWLMTLLLFYLVIKYLLR